MTPAEAIAELRAMHTPPLGAPCRWCEVPAPCPTLEVLDEATDLLPDGVRFYGYIGDEWLQDEDAYSVMPEYLCDTREAIVALTAVLPGVSK